MITFVMSKKNSADRRWLEQPFDIARGYRSLLYALDLRQAQIGVRFRF